MTNLCSFLNLLPICFNKKLQSPADVYLIFQHVYVNVYQYKTTSKLLLKICHGNFFLPSSINARLCTFGAHLTLYSITQSDINILTKVVKASSIKMKRFSWIYKYRYMQTQIPAQWNGLKKK